jgi:hypothetical protein
VLPLLAALSLAAVPAVPEGVLGTYRVQATLRAPDVPYASKVDLRGDVVLRAGDGPRAVRARLAANGKACELAGTLAQDGALAFADGQTCAIPLDDPLATGRVDATLRSGVGRVADGRVTLELELALAGMVHVGSGRLARETLVPIGGKASVSAEGTRDNSRAAAAP